MDNKELNIAIYKSLAAKAAELFQRTKIEAGTYSSKELADGKKDKKHLCWEMENGKEEITISAQNPKHIGWEIQTYRDILGKGPGHPF